jgi:hypothetical protein
MPKTTPMLPNGSRPDPRALAIGDFAADREGKVLDVILNGDSEGTNEAILAFLLAEPPRDYRGLIREPTVRCFTKSALEAGIIEAVRLDGGTVYIPLADGPAFARATPKGLAFRQKVLDVSCPRLGARSLEPPGTCQEDLAEVPSDTIRVMPVVSTPTVPLDTSARPSADLPQRKQSRKADASAANGPIHNEFTSEQLNRSAEAQMTAPQQTLPEIEFETPLEEEVESVEVPLGQRKVFTDQGDPEVESLHGKYKRGRLVVQPDFQRHFVWDLTKSSRLIESALLDIPLPVVYLAEGADEKEYVIDGQQRLTAFFSFIDGKFPDGRDFALKGLRVFKDLDKTFFRDLDDSLQSKIRYCKIRTITFRRESDANLRFEVFERLNSGAVALNDQELRNCIYRGPYNELLKELAKDAGFRDLLGLKESDRRMKDVELVLRFAAFHHATYLKYRSPMRSFLNQNMEERQNLGPAQAADLTEAFKKTVGLIESLLGERAFKRFYRGDAKNPNGRWEPKQFNASLFDILMYSFALADKNLVYRNLDAIRESFINLMTTDQDFIDAIELSTSSAQAVTKRFDKWRMVLQEVIGGGPKEPRLFSSALKEALFTANPTCTICNQRIQAVDDAALDHIEQYWLGGRTIPENARLTHRYCNMARSRKDGLESEG